MPKSSVLSNKDATSIAKTLLYDMTSNGRPQLEADYRLGKNVIVRATAKITDQGDTKLLDLNIFWRNTDKRLGVSISSYNDVVDGKIRIVADTYKVDVIDSTGSIRSTGDKEVTADEIKTDVIGRFTSEYINSILDSLKVLQYLEEGLKEQLETQEIYQVPKAVDMPEDVLSRLTDRLIEKMTAGGELHPDITLQNAGEGIGDIQVVSRFVSEGSELSITVILKDSDREVNIEGRYRVIEGVPRVVPFYYWVVLSKNGEITVARPTTTSGVIGRICDSNPKEFTAPIQMCLQILQSLEVQLRRQFES